MSHQNDMKQFSMEKKPIRMINYNDSNDRMIMTALFPMKGLSEIFFNYDRPLSREKI